MSLMYGPSLVGLGSPGLKWNLISYEDTLSLLGMAGKAEVAGLVNGIRFHFEDCFIGLAGMA